MRAAVVAAPHELRMTTVAAPEPAEGEVRVRLEGCGVCGSNLAPWEGRPWFKYPMAPGELGHEGWGRIDAVGPNTRQFRPGQRVAMLSYHAFAEFDLAPESAVVGLPQELDRHPFPGEALGCAMNVFRRSDIRAGQTVAIVGIGFLGAVLTILSARAGAKVLAFSRRPFALAMARRFGAAEAFEIKNDSSIVESVRDLTQGIGCDRVIEAAGKQSTLDLATQLTRERGRLVIAGYHQDGLRHIDLQLWNWRGLDVINAHERDPAVYRAGIEAAVQAAVSGWFDPAQLITHTFPLEKLSQAFNSMKERPDDFLKAVVTL